VDERVRESKSQRQSVCERERLIVCVCVCVIERERSPNPSRVQPYAIQQGATKRRDKVDAGISASTLSDGKVIVQPLPSAEGTTGKILRTFP